MVVSPTTPNCNDRQDAQGCHLSVVNAKFSRATHQKQMPIMGIVEGSPYTLSGCVPQSVTRVPPQAGYSRRQSQLFALPNRAKSPQSFEGTGPSFIGVKSYLNVI